MNLVFEAANPRRSGRNTKANVRVTLDGETIHTDTLILSSRKSWIDFLKPVQQHLGDKQPDDAELDKERLRLLEEADKELSDEATDTETTTSRLPVVRIGNRALRTMTAEAMQILCRRQAPVYVYGGMLCRVRNHEDGSVSIEALSESAMRGLLDRHADFVNSKGQPVLPPGSVVQDLLSLGSWPFLNLLGIVRAPILRPDGSVLHEPGYDPATQLFYAPAPGLEQVHIPNVPTASDITEARAQLADVLADFPFVDEASRAAAYAALFTAVLRPAIGGPVPMILFDAPAPGTGKGLLAEIVARTATGGSAEVMTAARDDEEWRKRITACLLSGSQIVHIDNIERPLNAPSLAAALTSTTWKDRLLGKSSVRIVPQRSVWLATGNNIRLGGDLPRRCIWCRLDARVERPWERKPEQFRHPDLAAYVRDHRPAILGALLTIGRGWFAVGAPAAASLPTLGSFEDWAQTIGGVLSWTGIPDFLANQSVLYDQIDDDAPQWRTFLECWFSTFGSEPKSVSQLIDAILDNPTFESSLPDDLTGQIESPGFARRLGIGLKKRQERVFGEGLSIRRARQSRHASDWQVIQEGRP
jgi:hypothetical protein